MDTRSDGGSHFLALERGEMFTETVTRFLADRAIRAGFVSAIGMLEDARLAWYDLETKTYRERVATGPREIASLTGNVTVRDGKPFLHAHAVLAAPDCTLLGGHFFEGRVAAAA
ncbi:MAG: DNA-binding protein, partial [Planctomycetes bacterium]|nr:DNA-binding protein [Planctomycetota bacterium]